MDRSFEQKAFVVTGGTQGVGLATACLIAERGARAIAICGRDKAKGELARQQVERNGARALFVRADLAEPLDCEKVIDDAVAEFGQLAGLINCCGVAHRGTLDTTNSDLWDQVFAVNVRAPFLLIRRIVPHLKAHGLGGTISNIGSVAAHGGQPYLVAYSAAKAALVVLTKNLANALRWDRIRVNALNIGWTATPAEHKLQMDQHGMGEDWLERVSKEQPFGRLLMPEDVARGLAFLAGPESGLMTGSVIDFDQRVIGPVDENPFTHSTLPHPL